MEAPLRIAVLGPGGVGGLLAALLARDGHQVTVLARAATAERIATGGLSLTSEALGDARVQVASATVLGDPVDAVLVTVKATQLDESLAAVPAQALGSALVVPFLNGLEHVERLGRTYPPDQVVAATIRVEAERVAPGTVVHRSPFAAVELASDAPRMQPALTRLAGALEHTGLSVSVRSGERQVLWDKLAVLAPLALFTTLDATPWGPVRAGRWGEVEQVVREIGAAAGAEGATVDSDRVLAFLREVPDGMRSSMQKDAEAGSPIEVDAIGGSLLRAGAAGGVAMPATERLVAAVGGDSGAGDPRS